MSPAPLVADARFGRAFPVLSASQQKPEQRALESLHLRLPINEVIECDEESKAGNKEHRGDEPPGHISAQKRAREGKAGITSRPIV